MKTLSNNHIGHPFGVPAWNKGKKVDRSIHPNMGRFGPRTSEEKEKIRISKIKSPHTLRGIRSPFWKGDKVGYRALHNWVEMRLGKPMECWLCNDNTKSRYQWANIGSYKRILSEWIRLCAKCHKIVDLTRKESYAF